MIIIIPTCIIYYYRVFVYIILKLLQPGEIVLVYFYNSNNKHLLNLSFD